MGTLKKTSTKTIRYVKGVRYKMNKTVLKFKLCNNFQTVEFDTTMEEIINKEIDLRAIVKLINDLGKVTNQTQPQPQTKPHKTNNQKQQYASDSQIAYMKGLGINVKGKITKAEAWKLINDAKNGGTEPEEEEYVDDDGYEYTGYFGGEPEE